MKYTNELQIKKALGIEHGNWRNLSRDKVIKFAAMMPDMDKEVMMEIIRMFPEFTKYGLDLLNALKSTIQNTIDKNSQDYSIALEIIKETQSICRNQLNKENLTNEERLLIWKNLMEITKIVPNMDKENKNFYKLLNNKYFMATVSALAIALSFIGGKVALDSFAEHIFKE